MTMDRFTAPNRPIDGTRAFPSSLPAPRGTARARAEELVVEDMAISTLPYGECIQRCYRRAEHPEVKAALARMWEEAGGEGPIDPGAELARKAAARSQEKGIELLEALEEIKLENPQLVEWWNANRDYRRGEPVEYRLAEVPPEPSRPSHMAVAWRARIGIALGLGPAASVGEILDAIGTLEPERLRRAGRALGLPPSAGVEDVRRAVARILGPDADDDEPDADESASAVEPRGPVHGYKGVRKLLAERAQRLADERQIPYTQALSELAAQDPGTYQRALLEY